MKRAIKLRKKKKLTPSMNRRTIEDWIGRAGFDQPGRTVLTGDVFPT